MAAESKRQGGKGSGAPAVNLGPSGMVSLETALSGAIGARCDETLSSIPFPLDFLTNTFFFAMVIVFALRPHLLLRIPSKALFSLPAQLRT